MIKIPCGEQLIRQKHSQLGMCHLAMAQTMINNKVKVEQHGATKKT